MSKIEIKNWMVLAVFLMTFMIIVILLLVPSRFDSDPREVQRAHTESILWLYGGRIDYWIKEYKRAPTTEEGLSVLGLRGGPPVDGWKRLIRYRRKGQGVEFILYSIGPNGIDENGAGDDISFRAKGGIQ